MNKWRWLCDLCRRSRSAASPPTLPVPHPVPSQGSSEPAKCFWVSLRRQYAWKSKTFSSSSTSETYFLAQEKQTSIKNLKISKNCIHEYNLLWWLKISEWRTSLIGKDPGLLLEVVRKYDFPIVPYLRQIYKWQNLGTVEFLYFGVKIWARISEYTSVPCNRDVLA